MATDTILSRNSTAEHNGEFVNARIQPDNLYCGDALELLRQMDAGGVQCCITSPPYYGLRDYGAAGQIGLEVTPEIYVEKLVAVFREVRRVLQPDGVLWLNLGDSYWGSSQSGGDQTKRVGGGIKQLQHQQAENKNVKVAVPLGCKPKDLMGIPWMVAFALRADGWWLRQDIIWAKPNPMPESVTDRCTKAHEYIFLLTKSAQYHYNAEAIYELANYDGRKDTMMKGSQKYANGFYDNEDATQTMAARGHERWPRKLDVTKTAGNGSSLANHSGCVDMETSKYLGHILDGAPARNRRSVWTIPTKPYKQAHFATFPPELPRLCIMAGSKQGDIILDPFCGSGTTLFVARELGRRWIGFDISEKYCTLARRRVAAARVPLPSFDNASPPPGPDAPRMFPDE